MSPRGRAGRARGAASLWVAFAAACLAPTPLEPPSASWIAEADGELYAYQSGDPMPLFEARIERFHGYPTNGLEGVPSGRLERAVERPCPLPPTAERWRVDGDTLRAEPLVAAASPGWFEGPDVAPTPVVVASPCGPGGVSLTANRRGCAIDFRTSNPEQPRGRLGLTRGPLDGAPLLASFDALTLGAVCATAAATAPALGALRCVEPNRDVCYVDVYEPPPDLRVTVARKGQVDPGFAPPNNPLQAPVARRWSGLALTAHHVWIAGETQSPDFSAGCREPATLVAVPRRADATPLEVPALRTAPCTTELFTRPGVPGFFAVARSSTAAEVTCPIRIGETWSPRPWVLVHYDDDGSPRATRMIGGACGARIVFSEPEADGPMLFAASEVFGTGPRRSWAWTITPERLEVSEPLLLERNPNVADDPGVELASLTHRGRGRVLGLDLQRKALVEFELQPGALAPRPSMRDLPSIVGESADFPAWHRRMPDGRLAAFTAGRTTSGGLWWTVDRLDEGAASSVFVSHVGAPSDVLAAEPWPRRSWLRPARARFALIRTEHRARRSELRWYEVIEEERRVRELPDTADLGEEPPYPRLVVDEDDHLWGVMAWTGTVFRVAPP